MKAPRHCQDSPEGAGSASAIVSVYNESRGSLERTLVALLAQVRRPDRIIVVDDGSSVPPTIEGALASEVELVRLPDNVGLSEARNRGALLSTSDYLLFVNSDVVLEQEWLERGLAFMESHTDVGALSGVIVPMIGPQLLRSWRLQFIETKVHRTATASPQSVTWLVGHVLLVRRSVFEAIRGFDSRFRCAGEDWDISQRIRSSGWLIFHLPELVAESYEPTSIDRLARKMLRNRGWDLRQRSVGWKPCAAVRPVRPFATTASIAGTWIEQSARNVVKGRFSLLPVDMAVAFRSLVLGWRSWQR
jgi:GT2 family glycosyltransferase